MGTLAWHDQKSKALESLARFFGRKELLAPNLAWTVVEDRDALNNASMDCVAADHFGPWAEGASDERDGPGAIKSWQLPRFNYCVIVDRICMDSLVAYDAAIANGVTGRDLPPIFVVLLEVRRALPSWAQVLLWDGHLVVPPDSDDDDVNKEKQGENIEDDEYSVHGDSECEVKKDWMFVEISKLVSLYNICHGDSVFYTSYVRPPGVFGRDPV